MFILARTARFFLRPGSMFSAAIGGMVTVASSLFYTVFFSSVSHSFRSGFSSLLVDSHSTGLILVGECISVGRFYKGYYKLPDVTTEFKLMLKVGYFPSVWT